MLDGVAGEVCCGFPGGLGEISHAAPSLQMIHSVESSKVATKLNQTRSDTAAHRSRFVAMVVCEPLSGFRILY